MSMVTYEFSDFRRLLMVTYRYIRIHTDTYGYIWMCMVTYVGPDFRKATLLVTYEHIWAYMNEYGHLWAL